MAKIEYRAYIQSHDLIGAGFLEDIITVAKQGGEIDSDQTRLAFPHNATMFLESDKVLESTPTITYTVLTQLFTSRADLDAMSIDTFRKEMKLVGLKCRDRDQASKEYLRKFGIVEVALEASETPPEDVVTEEASLPPTEVIQEVVEAPVEDSKEVDVTVAKQRGRKAK